jgi:hypothetical protein
MPLQNRVTPFGDLIETPARGMLLGNRGGRFHDPATRSLRRRRWASRQWIACVLDFKERHRTVWQTGYTELFFLDEVTALAAGHRPCFECRRADAKAFAAAVASGLDLSEPPRVPDMDRRLHAERLSGRDKRRHSADVTSLPDGAVVEMDGRALAVRGEHLLPWAPEGYAAAAPRPVSGNVTVLTPPTIVAALKAGYRPLWHPDLAV